MPSADGGKEHPSSSGSNLAARRNQKPLDQRLEVSRPVQKEGSANGLAVATAVAPAPAAVTEQGLPEPPTRTTGATNGQRRGQHPAYSVPFDGWSRELDGRLAEFCKRGREGEREAILAIRKDHPEISADTIWARIKYLGLTTSKRRPYSQHVWSPEDFQLVLSGYSNGRNGASRTIDALCERHPDWSRSVISWKAKSLGLSRKRKKYQPWSENADRQLISCEGLQLQAASGEERDRLKPALRFGKSENVIVDPGNQPSPHCSRILQASALGTQLLEESGAPVAQELGYAPRHPIRCHDRSHPVGERLPVLVIGHSLLELLGTHPIRVVPGSSFARRWRKPPTLDLVAPFVECGVGSWPALLPLFVAILPIKPGLFPPQIVGSIILNRDQPALLHRFAKHVVVNPPA